MGEPGVIDLNDKRPFRAKAREYRAKGWLNTLWLPLRAKEPPPTGFTGRPVDGISNDVTEDILEEWMAGPYTERANIAIHLGFGVTIKSTDSTGKVTAQEYCVLGIDVDENDDNPAKPKRGWSQLKRLEKVLGEELPPTWTSSARDNGTSGIRFYLVPKGLEWRGSCSESGGKHIDIVSFSHKYSIVYPSIHPLGTQYLWYPPGVSPSGPGALIDKDGTNRLGEIPNATDLAVLGPKWVDYLSRGGTLDTGAVPIEMDRSIKELKQWCIDEFVPGLGEGCTMIQNAVAKHLENIENNADHHYPLQEAHWHLFLLGAEGHHGWLTAIKTIEKAWRARIADEGAASKRSVEKAESELERSRNGALRKLRGKADARAKEGYQFISRIELCYTPPKDIVSGVNNTVSGVNNTAAVDNSGGDGGHWIDRVTFDGTPDPAKYEDNDDSQAKYFLDVFGSSVRFLEGSKDTWVIYDGLTWHKESSGFISHLYKTGCLKPLKDRENQFRKEADEYAKKQGNTKTDADYLKLIGKAKACKAIYDHYSNQPKRKNMLIVASQVPGIPISDDELDWDDTLLAMPNGKVIRLDRRTRDEEKNAVSQGYSIEDNRKLNYTTMLTEVNFQTYEQLMSTEAGKAQLEQWSQTVHLFLPDEELRRFVQRVFGHMLIGGNIEKKMMFMHGPGDTGKSTFVNTFRVGGDYSKAFNPQAVFKEGSDKPNQELVNLVKKRIIYNSEGGTHLNASMIKSASGSDAAPARGLWSKTYVGQDGYKFSAIMALNKVPTIINEDEQLRNRMLAIPFKTQVPKADQDKQRVDDLHKICGSAILLWLLDGYREYVRIGLDEKTWPASVLKSTAEFCEQLSPLGQFLGDMCEVAPPEVMRMFKIEATTKEQKEILGSWHQINVDELMHYYKIWLGKGGGAVQKGRFIKDLAGLDITTKVRRYGTDTRRGLCGIKVDKIRMTKLQETQQKYGNYGG